MSIVLAALTGAATMTGVFILGSLKSMMRKPHPSADRRLW